MLVSRTSPEKRTKLKQNARLPPAVSDAMLAYDDTTTTQKSKKSNRRTQDAKSPGNPYCYFHLLFLDYRRRRLVFVPIRTEATFYKIVKRSFVYY